MAEKKTRTRPQQAVVRIPPVVGGKYRLEKRIGGGSFGDIYKGVQIGNNEEFAVKMEPVTAKMPQLLYECKLYKHLSGGQGIPFIKWCGTEGPYNIMVMELLGKSLEDLMCDKSREHFSLKTSIMLADQMICRLEYLHNKDYVHRDIKPDNFMMGRKNKKNIVHIIDFGLAKRYRDSSTHQHIPYKDGRGMTGTVRYASINSQQGMEQGRRDDLESVGYVLIYFITGNLPWQGLKIENRNQKFRAICDMKMSIPVEQLCKDCPAEISQYMKYVKDLSFDAKPDYFYLRRLFRTLFMKSLFQLDYIYDWTLPEGEEEKEEEEHQSNKKKRKKSDEEEDDDDDDDDSCSSNKNNATAGAATGRSGADVNDLRSGGAEKKSVDLEKEPVSPKNRTGLALPLMEVSASNLDSQPIASPHLFAVPSCSGGGGVSSSVTAGGASSSSSGAIPSSTLTTSRGGGTQVGAGNINLQQLQQQMQVLHTQAQQYHQKLVLLHHQTQAIAQKQNNTLTQQQQTVYNQQSSVLQQKIQQIQVQAQQLYSMMSGSNGNNLPSPHGKLSSEGGGGGNNGGTTSVTAAPLPATPTSTPTSTTPSIPTSIPSPTTISSPSASVPATSHGGNNNSTTPHTTNNFSNTSASVNLSAINPVTLQQQLTAIQQQLTLLNQVQQKQQGKLTAQQQQQKNLLISQQQQAATMLNMVKLQQQQHPSGKK